MFPRPLSPRSTVCAGCDSPPRGSPRAGARPRRRDGLAHLVLASQAVDDGREAREQCLEQLTVGRREIVRRPGQQCHARTVDAHVCARQLVRRQRSPLPSANTTRTRTAPSARPTTRAASRRRRPGEQPVRQVEADLRLRYALPSRAAQGRQRCTVQPTGTAPSATKTMSTTTSSVQWILNDPVGSVKNELSDQEPHDRGDEARPGKARACQPPDGDDQARCHGREVGVRGTRDVRRPHRRRSPPVPPGSRTVRVYGADLVEALHGARRGPDHVRHLVEDVHDIGDADERARRARSVAALGGEEGSGRVSLRRGVDQRREGRRVRYRSGQHVRVPGTGSAGGIRCGRRSASR